MGLLLVFVMAPRLNGSPVKVLPHSTGDGYIILLYQTLVNASKTLRSASWRNAGSFGSFLLASGYNPNIGAAAFSPSNEVEMTK